METRQENQIESSLIVKIFYALRKNLFLILAIVFIATSLGLGYAYMKKPNYTARVRVSFSIDGNTTATINEMRVYIDTIIDFCGQGVVVDRANAYYIEWIDNYQQDYYAQNKDIEDFFHEFAIPKEQGETDYNTIFTNYQRPNSNQPGTLKDEAFLSSGAISTQTAKTEDATNWVYTVGYTASNQLDAYEKAYILVLAYKHELYWDRDLGNDGLEQYFTGLTVNIDSLGFDGIVTDVSKTKITIIAFCLGVLIALTIVFIKSRLDNTVRDKDEFERLSGTQVVGTINYVREKDKNGK